MVNCGLPHDTSVVNQRGRGRARAAALVPLPEWRRLGVAAKEVKGGGGDVSKRASLVGGAHPLLERDAAAGGGRAAETLYTSSLRVDKNVLHTCDEYIDKAKV